MGPRLIYDLFSKMNNNNDDSKQNEILFSVLQIYNEKISDLLSLSDKN